MNALPDHLGGYQHLAEDVLTQEGDIYVECGKPYELVRAFGETVGALEQMHGYNIYRRIPVAKQGDIDGSGWKKVAHEACPALSPAAAESVQRLKDAICAPVKTAEVTLRGGENEGKRISIALPTEAKARKGIPVYSGFIKYFPLAIAEVAKVSQAGNDQHNPGSPLHWDRSKSGDELDALGRHFLDAEKFDTDGQRHSAKIAWRAMANLQKELEQETNK
jgi:hypothetical protein